MTVKIELVKPKKRWINCENKKIIYYLYKITIYNKILIQKKFKNVLKK